MSTVNRKNIAIFNWLVIEFFIIHFQQIAMFFLFLKNAEFSVYTICLLLCFGWDKGKTMRLSVEGDCPDGTAVIFIKADRFAIIVVNGIIYQRTTIRVNSCINAGNNFLSHMFSSILMGMVRRKI